MPRSLRVGLWIAALMLVSELGFNIFFFRSRLGSAKVLNELSSDLSMLSIMMWEAAWMMALVVAPVVALGWVWGSVCLAVFDQLEERLRAIPLGRPFFWFLSIFCFFRVWYSAHQLAFPGSRLFQSPLYSVVGALGTAFPGLRGQYENGIPPSVLISHWAPTVAATLFVAVFVIIALWRSRSARLGLGAALALFVATTWTYSVATDLRRVTRFESRKSVVMLGLDSFQMNRLAVGGAAENLAPNVNAFVEESLRFDNAWTPIARTYPSWLSILTGRYPSSHGVRFNLMPDEAIAPDNEYLPAVLQEQGYTTFHATDETRFSIIRSTFGFDHQFHPKMGLADWVLGTFFDFSAINFWRQTHFGHDLFPAIANNRASPAYNPRIWVRNALKELNELPADEPLFAALHLCGNHWPFSTPAPYSWARRSKVERSIVMVDDQVEVILEYLEAAGLRERATVFMLSDHGDGHSGDPDDRYNDHGNSFKRIEANRILLAVQGPDIAPGVVNGMVRTIDLKPTILDRLGFEPRADADGGRSLLPALEGRAIDDRPVFAETGMVRKVVNVRKLVRDNAQWYALDMDTGLMHMRPEGVDEFLPVKEFMYVRDHHRMVVIPHLKRLQVHPIDPDRGVDLVGPPHLPAAEGLDMLAEMAAHFDLDREELTSIAVERGIAASRAR